MHTFNHAMVTHMHTCHSENGGSGQQCCYNQNGSIVTGPPGGGTVDLVAPVDGESTKRHFEKDELPYFYCCWGIFPNCDAYYQKRPSDDGSRYRLSVPGEEMYKM